MTDFIYVLVASMTAGILSLSVAVLLVQKASWSQYLIKYKYKKINKRTV